MGLGRGEGEGAAAEHGGRQPIHHRLSLNVEIAIHLIRPPSTDEANPIAINAGAEKCHGAAGTGRANRDVAESVRRVGVFDEGGPDADGDV